MDALSEQFLCGVPVAKMDFDTVLENLVDNEHGVSNQDNLISCTVDHPLVLKYPLKLAYQQCFLRTLLKKLEETGVEIGDNLYSRHCELLTKREEANDKSYRHYSLARGPILTMMESTSLVSLGTTGLCTWQASQVLINWCAQHIEFLKGKRILELGSGVGLCGIAVSLVCEPSLFCFSDCHDAVLDRLKANILLNAKVEERKTTLLDSFENCVWLGRVNKTDVAVLDLPWENIAGSDISKDLSLDIVLASDIVYDSSSFESLSSAILNLTKNCKIIMACTERNPDTLNNFLQLLGFFNLEVSTLSIPKTSVIMNSLDDTVVKLLSIQLHRPM